MRARLTILNNGGAGGLPPPALKKAGRQIDDHGKTGVNMIAKLYNCDDCGREAEFTSYVKARLSGWAVSKDYSKCYCPACAPLHRKGNAAAKNYEVAKHIPDGWEQLKIL